MIGVLSNPCSDMDAREEAFWDVCGEEPDDDPAPTQERPEAAEYIGPDLRLRGDGQAFEHLGAWWFECGGRIRQVERGDLRMKEAA